MECLAIQCGEMTALAVMWVVMSDHPGAAVADVLHPIRGTFLLRLVMPI